MAVSAVMAAVSTGVTALSGGAFLGIAAIGLTGAFGHFLITTAMGAALNALSPKPNLGGTRGYSLAGESGSALDHQIIYGRTRVGGVRIYDASTGTNNNFLHRILAFAGHEIESYDEIYLNDEIVTIADAYQYTVEYVSAGEVTVSRTAVVSDGSYSVGDIGISGELLLKLAKDDPLIIFFASVILVTAKVTLESRVIAPERYVDNVRIKRYYGTTTQTADPDLVSETSGLTENEGRWTTSHRLQGIAYLYVRFKYSQDAFPNGVPTVSVTAKGKKVYDPRTATTVWSDNPALCLRDYLSSAYGLAQPNTRIDDTAVTTAANICDELVSGEKRYTCNGSFVTSFAPSQIVSDLLTSMGGLFWYSQGKWRIKAAKYSTPTVTLDENDLRSGISLSTRHSRRNNFNTVKGTFRGPESDWQPADYPKVSDPAFVSADNNIENVVDVPLPFTADSVTAQRLANIFLRRNREQLTFSASFGLKAFQVQVGDFVYINNTRFGWVNKPFEVTSWTFGLVDGLDLQVQMTLREISSAVFTLQDAAIFEANNTNLPSAFYAEPVGLSLSGEVRVINENLTDVILANVTATQPANVERVEVQFKKTSAPNWTVIGVGDLGIYEAVVVDPSTTYDFRARSYSFLGVKSDWEYVNAFQPVGLAAPPADVTNFRANLNGGVINLEWNAVPDLDLSYYLVRHALEESGATFANSTTALEKVSRPGTSASVPTRPGTYAIRAYDKLGNPSINSTQVVVPVAALETFTNNLTDTESPTFPGTKTGCSVVSSQLRITDTSVAPSSATYTFTGFIDTGAVRRVRSRVDINVNRFDSSAGLFDSITGLFDSIPGLFDDFTGGSQFSDTDVLTYISITEQDPAGTPTWSPYQLFKAGDFYGRAFRFQVVLNSQTVGVSPSISGLTARVQYN
jgi:hypothetical protein